MRIAAESRVVVAMSIVGETAFQLIPLAGEVVVVRCGSGDGIDAAIRQIGRLPDRCTGFVGHHDRPVEAEKL